jgi:hypothetical protein
VERRDTLTNPGQFPLIPPSASSHRAEVPRHVSAPPPPTLSGDYHNARSLQYHEQPSLQRNPSVPHYAMQPPNGPPNRHFPYLTSTDHYYNPIVKSSCLSYVPKAGHSQNVQGGEQSSMFSQQFSMSQLFLVSVLICSLLYEALTYS